MKRTPVALPITVWVDDSVRYQRIIGFGAALTDSSAWLIHHELRAATRARLMGHLFGSEGINLNYLRVLMGASDFTARGKPYTYDDLPPGQSDPGLRHFSIRHDLRHIIPTLHQALAINPGIYIVANPFTAPGWMKTNQRLDNYSQTGTLLANAYDPLAAYFVRFIHDYRTYGVSVAGVTPQNEPSVAADPGMELTQADEDRFISGYLGPAFAAAGLRTKIYGVDASWDMWWYADALATGPADRYLSGIAWHCYFDNPTAMTEFHALAPQAVEIINECSPEIRAFHTPEALIGSLRNWASAIALWNVALDPSGGPVEPPNHRCPGCKGLVTIDETTHAARLGATYYLVGQVSKFVARGAVRIGANTFVSDQLDGGIYSPTPGLDDVAFINPDGEKVLVTYNNSPAPIQCGVNWHRHSFVYLEPPGAMTTFTWK